MSNYEDNTGFIESGEPNLPNNYVIDRENVDDGSSDFFKRNAPENAKNGA
jgi:hypothetical protein